MKKSLIALAVLAAAGAASAQSSVTLFGVVDATIAVGRGNVTDRTQLTNSGYNSSRLGFRGTEDLGGGLSASFWLEAGLANDDGQGAATNANNQGLGVFDATTGANSPVRAGSQGLTFNRRSTVSLAGGFGEIRLGRDYTPQFYNLTVFDPYGTNGVGTTQTLVSSLGGVTSIRASNSIGYLLPANLGGLYGQVQYYLGENPQDGTVAQRRVEDDGQGYGIRLGYAAGPINVAAAMSRTEYRDPGVGAFRSDVRQNNIGAQYDFGVAKLMAHISRDKGGVGGLAEGRGFLVGGLFPIGAGEIRASFSRYRTEIGIARPESSKIAVGYVHNLSKRTALYTTYARVKNEGFAATQLSSVSGGPSALNGAVGRGNASSTGFDFGVRHSF